MIGFYILAAIAGGVLVGVNVLTGGHSHEFDTDVQADLDHGGHDSANPSLWLPFFSLRFWTYFFATTGLTGLLLTYMTALQEPTTLMASLSTGFLCGLAVALAVRFLSRYDSDSATNVGDLLGTEAKVLVTVRKDIPGKVRCHLRGDTLDLLALAQEEEELAPGSDVVIVAIEGDRAMVVPRAALYG